ncbi:hypothetical protein Moror_8329 [Moniliophthora roreri MCA 2997]|uniref:Secreted protein n=2 Tax=Moniliophthora roreri TaxID=221103 RepID=V2YR56_MONRO|nr:hypothetical protein Moror_8329 [Moniliophthora roreri MCA 2997]KAI3619384.1 hypothetical protein WG66_012734 [Moniliophthora roreri]
MLSKSYLPFFLLSLISLSVASPLAAVPDNEPDVVARVVQNRFWKREPNVAYWREDDSSELDERDPFTPGWKRVLN